MKQILRTKVLYNIKIQIIQGQLSLRAQRTELLR